MTLSSLTAFFSVFQLAPGGSAEMAVDLRGCCLRRLKRSRFRCYRWSANMDCDRWYEADDKRFDAIVIYHILFELDHHDAIFEYWKYHYRCIPTFCRWFLVPVLLFRTSDAENRPTSTIMKWTFTVSAKFHYV